MEQNQQEGTRVLLRIQDLKQYFRVKGSGGIGRKAQYVKANDGITLDIYEGETLGLVGESGCGKSTFGRSILQLYPETKGEVLYYGGMREEGVNLAKLTKKEMNRMRKDLQLVFQDPYSSLNPKMTIGEIIAEGVRLHGIRTERKEIEQYTIDILKSCGLSDSMMHRYPHEFSGGQRQRVGIARSLALHPKFLVCDEAVSALDVSIQSQIINLLMDLKEQEHLTYLFISHDLSVIQYISDRIGVMYLGKLVELSGCEELFRQPLHPYTKVLLSAIPSVESQHLIPVELIGEPPSPSNPPSGCRFHTRCPYCKGICKEQEPELREIESGHQVACHFAKELK